MSDTHSEHAFRLLRLKKMGATTERALEIIESTDKAREYFIAFLESPEELEKFVNELMFDAIKNTDRRTVN
jgi:hypothetical protein